MGKGTDFHLHSGRKDSSYSTQAESARNMSDGLARAATRDICRMLTPPVLGEVEPIQHRRMQTLVLPMLILYSLATPRRVWCPDAVFLGHNLSEHGNHVYIYI